MVASELYNPSGAQSQGPYVQLPGGSVCTAASQSIGLPNVFVTDPAVGSDFLFAGDYSIDLSHKRSYKKPKAGTMDAKSVLELYQLGMVSRILRRGQGCMKC
jgi:hypothetical protein